MKKIVLMFWCSCVWVSLAVGQSLTPQVTASAGGFGTTTTGTSLSWTLGEPITTTTSSSTNILTQGFQQPNLVVIAHQDDLPKEALSFSVFPNPTMDYITIQKEHQATLQVELIDVLGRVLQTLALNDAQTQLSVVDLPASTYFLRISNQRGESIKTFSIQKIR